MAQQVTLDRDKTAVLIMDFQQRIVNNVASDPQGVVQPASQGSRERARLGFLSSCGAPGWGFSRIRS
jgi:hypothetical protein